VPNATFSRALGRALHRPSLVPVPAFALRVIVGEFAQSGLIEGQRVIPQRALDAGFRFKFPDLDGALRAAVG
jgi:NAD dependent epimerase/dehydratase family enzyme